MPSVLSFVGNKDRMSEKTCSTINFGFMGFKNSRGLNCDSKSGSILLKIFAYSSLSELWKRATMLFCNKRSDFRVKNYLRVTKFG